LETLMRPHSFVSLLALSVTAFGITSCSKPAEKAADTGEAKATAAQVTPAPVNADVLKSLTAEQQTAVRALIRDELVANPEILLEAQRAFETKQARVQNEKVASAFKTLKSDHAQFSFGPANAKITVIEFFDYKCGFCHAAQGWVSNLMQTRKDVRVIFKELPILSENSSTAAKAAIAAHNQGKYLQMHNALMTAQGDLNPEQIFQIAASVGLNVEKLKADMAKPQVEATITGMRDQATNLNIGGTPGFVINGKLVSGFNQEELENALATAGVDISNPPPASGPKKG
jgi:protein-disulfide isomerase